MLFEVVLDPSLDEAMGEAFRMLQEGSFEDAREAFTRCLVRDPGCAKAYAGRAMAHFKLKHWSLAAEDFRTARNLDPEEPEHALGLGMGLAMENKIYEAIEVFEALLAKFPNFVRGHIQLGQLYYRLGVIAKGHAEMEAALAARPTLADRRLIEQLQKEQRELDKRRYSRPDFEALRKQNASSGPGLFTSLRDGARRLFRAFRKKT